MIRKHLIIALLTLSAAFCSPCAQAQRLSDEDLQKALTEMRNFKHSVFTKELQLTKDQQQKFFDVYDAMDRELMVIGNEVRDLERKTLADDKASDTECAATARALFEQKKRESDVELKYFDRLADVLTPRQLIKLKSAERKIAMQLANYHGRQQKARRAPADKK
jgi:Spy/CpxP family protein refolding chaperone